MPSPLKDIEALFVIVKELRDERRKMARLSERASNLTGRQFQKANTDLNWQAFHVNRLEHAAHAAAVNASLADARSPEHYAPYTVKLTGFHEYSVEPQKPRSLLTSTAAVSLQESGAQHE